MYTCTHTTHLKSPAFSPSLTTPPHGKQAKPFANKPTPVIPIINPNGKPFPHFLPYSITYTTMNPNKFPQAIINPLELDSFNSSDTTEAPVSKAIGTEELTEKLNTPNHIAILLKLFGTA